MLTNEHIKQLINECREIGDGGLDNGIHAAIPDLRIDIVTPPLDFLGVNSNPAIFINKSTFKLLGYLHNNWIVDQTIALKVSLLNQTPMQIIGAIVHETGHAFNVAAKIENTEANAYIFEIEAIRHLLKTDVLLPLGCSASDVQTYFTSRLPYYIQGAHNNEYLAQLIDKIKSPPEPEPIVQLQIKSGTSSFFINKRITLFSYNELPRSKDYDSDPDYICPRSKL